MTIDAAGTLLRAAQHLDAAASLATVAHDLPLPNVWFRSRAIAQIHAAYGAATDEAMRGVRALEPLGAPLEDARAGVRRSLDEIDPAIQYAIHDQRRYTAAEIVPGELRMHADRLRLRAELDTLEPAAARARMQSELDDIVALPNEALTRAQRWRAGVISGLPEHQRPVLPELVRHNYPLDHLAVRNFDPATESMSRGEWANLRLDLARRQLAADPSITREALDAEVRAIIATPDQQVTREMNERLSMIAGLGDDLRPSILDTRVPWPQHKLAQLSAWGWTPATNGDAKAKYGALRMAMQHEEMLRDPALTSEAVTDELMGILSLPDELITTEQLYRTSLLSRLPEHVRPPMPAKLDWHYRFEDLGLHGYHPARHRSAEKVFDLMRVHMAAVVDPERAAAQLKARIDAGEQIDIRVIAALSRHDGLLERAGLTQDVLHRQAVLALAGAGTGSTEALSHHLAIVRDTISRMDPTEPGLVSLRNDALELAERNLDRMAGRRSDTFSRHPDYAEVGQFVAIADLLDALGRSAPVPAPAANVVDPAAVVGTKAELLDW